MNRRLKRKFNKHIKPIKNAWYYITSKKVSERTQRVLKHRFRFFFEGIYDPEYDLAMFPYINIPIKNFEITDIKFIRFSLSDTVIYPLL